MIRLLYPKFWKRRAPISYLLLPFSLIYFVCSKIRFLYARQIKLPAPVICVGNINIGGTGKTQVVIFLAKWFKSINIDFVIITKAYNSSLKTAVIVTNNHQAREVGDESVMLRSYGRVIAAKHINHAVELLEILKPKIIIIDDGMQNPYFYKDFTILTIDGTRKFGNGFLIPGGPLREPVRTGLKKADMVIIVGGKARELDELFSVKFPSLPIFHAKISPITDNLDKSKNYFAFCSIGNPEKFLITIKDMGLNLVGFKIYQDHHHYTEQDIKYLLTMKANNDSLLITTEKDYVKISQSIDAICVKTQILFIDDIAQ